MTGWIGDFFRFWWALFYWNTRKTWFRLRGAERDSCPCQTYSDSGLALDSRCDAVIPWHRPVRFRRVCPLLTETPEGWRCGVDAERVRPFWIRAFLYAAGTALALYLVGSVAAFATLRLAKYDVSYLSVVWPRRWHELRGAQERLYARRAQEAMAARNYPEAVLALEMVCQLNPRNYPANLALANLCQLSANPLVAEHIYERLMRDVPEKRVQTAQIWIRTLLARGAYDKIKPLAAAMLTADPGQGGAWLNALLFAARATNDSGFLATVLEHRGSLPAWCVDLIGIERGLLLGQVEEVLPQLTKVYRQPGAAYVPYYQVDRLLRHRLFDQATDLLNRYGALMPPDEAAFLYLRLYRAQGWKPLVETERETLLQFPMTPRIAAEFCACLIAHPDSTLLTRYLDKFIREGPPLAAGTLPVYQASYLTAALADDELRAETIANRIKQFTGSDVRVLRGLAELLRAPKADGRLGRIMPLVPLPTEVIYAVLERQATPAHQ